MTTIRADHNYGDFIFLEKAIIRWKNMSLLQQLWQITKITKVKNQ